jgi:hypothetical protein
VGDLIGLQRRLAEGAAALQRHHPCRSWRRYPGEPGQIGRGSPPRPTLPSTSKTVCQQPIPGLGHLPLAGDGWNKSPSNAGAPHRPASRIAVTDRSKLSAGTPR